MSHLKQAYAFDIRFRVSDDHAAPEGVVILAREIDEGVVFDRRGLKVTAFKVDHAPVEPAFGYRVDHLGRSVVLSGDTRVSENLVRYAQGVDVLIHEVAVPESFRRSGTPAARVESVTAHHVTPEQAAGIFARTRPRLAVYSHIVRADATDQEILAPTMAKYPGPVRVAEDLMVIEVGETIDVHRPRHEANPAKADHDPLVRRHDDR